MEKCTGLYTNEAQTMSGRNSGIQALIRKKVTCIIWTHFMVHRQAFVTKNMSEELQTVRQANIRVAMSEEVNLYDDYL
jgi:hypothetical protein